MAETNVQKCGQPWKSDPSKLCEALLLPIPGATTCLAHASDLEREQFLNTRPEHYHGVELHSLEISPDLVDEIDHIFADSRST
jgi:hypothetical protein